MVRARASSAVGDADRLPLSTRLKAWWNGYDPRDYAALSAPAGGTQTAVDMDEMDGEEETPERLIYEVRSVNEGWPEARIKLNELISEVLDE